MGIEVVDEERAMLVRTMQDNLKSVRRAMDLSASELGKYLGLSPQSMSKLETHSSKLTVPQYIAIRYLVDAYMGEHPDNRIIRSCIEYVDGGLEKSWTDVIFGANLVSN